MDSADAAIAATLSTDATAYYIVNIGAGNDVTVGGLVDLFADALGRTIPIERCNASRVRKDGPHAPPGRQYEITHEVWLAASAQFWKLPSRTLLATGRDTESSGGDLR